MQRFHKQSNSIFLTRLLKLNNADGNDEKKD